MGQRNHQQQDGAFLKDGIITDNPQALGLMSHFFGGLMFHITETNILIYIYIYISVGDEFYPL